MPEAKPRIRRNEPKAPPAPKGSGLRRAATKAKSIAADGALKPYAYPIKPPTLAPGVVPAGVVAPVMAQPVAEQAPACGGIIELTVGKARLRLEGAVDTAVLHLVLQRLLP